MIWTEVGLCASLRGLGDTAESVLGRRLDADIHLSEMVLVCTYKRLGDGLGDLACAGLPSIVTVTDRRLKLGELRVVLLYVFILVILCRGII